jgi:hypothetical protein
MAFLAGAPMFGELILGAEEGLGAIVSGFSSEFVKNTKQSIATAVGSEIADIANKNPDGITNMSLNQAIRKKNHRISNPRKLGRNRKHI